MSSFCTSLSSRRQALLTIGVFTLAGIASRLPTGGGDDLLMAPPLKIQNTLHIPRFSLHRPAITKAHWAELWERSPVLSKAVPLKSFFNPPTSVSIPPSSAPDELIVASSPPSRTSRILQKIKSPLSLGSLSFGVVEPKIALPLNAATLSAGKSSPATKPARPPLIPTAVVAAIKIGAQKTGLSPGFMASVAWLESRFKPGATHDGCATGLYQFLSETWLSIIHKNAALLPAPFQATASQIYPLRDGGWTGLRPGQVNAVVSWRLNPAISAIAAGAEMVDNGYALQSAFRRPPRKTDLYLSHVMGLGGAIDFLEAVDAGEPIPLGVVGGNGAVINGPTALCAYEKLQSIITAKIAEYSPMV